MTKRIGIFSILVALASCASGAQAQDAASSPPPSPPYVGALSGDFAFTKKYVYKKQQDNPNESKEQRDVRQFLASRFPTPIELDSTQTGALRLNKQSFTNGLVIQIWRVPHFRMTDYSTAPDDIEVTGAGPSDKSDDMDFQELDWLSATTYQQTQTYEGQACYVFKQNNQTAYVSKSTHLPVYFESDAMQIFYTYKKPDEQLQLPEKFAQKLQSLPQLAGQSH